MPFDLLRTQSAPDLQGTLYTYRHAATGLVHHHLATPHAEQTFSIAFPTQALDNKGQAHVLEHVVLCGSQKYPVHDSFMAMTQRSLASFMNAMTYGDRTVYAFATPDAQDFENLLSVYLDAVFSPLLRRESFSQEGVRLEYSATGAPRIEGVVYHEMKGTLADPGDIADRAIRAALLPNTPYAFESGGTPAGIRTLDYASLVAFYREHYHPANAVAISHGDLDVAILHRELEQAMAPWESRATPAKLPLAAFATTLTSPVRQTVAIPGSESPEEEAEEDNQTLVRAWALGPTFDQDEGLIADFVLQAWAGGDASPLLHAMSEQGYGRPGGLTFAQTEEKHALFSLAMDGLSAHTLPKAERLIAEALVDVAQNGLPADHLQAVFAGFETHLRERGNNGDPVGIELALEMLPAALAGADPLCAVDPARLVARHADLTNPAFIAQWVRTRLLQNPAQAVLTLVPDADWFERQEREEGRFLADLSAEQKSALAVPDTRTPLASNDRLPCVDLNTVNRVPQAPLPLSFEPASPHQAAQAHVTSPTPGLLQIGAALDLTALPPSEWPLAHLLWSLVLHLGVRNKDWQEAGAWRTQGTVGMTNAIVGMLSRKHDGNWLPMLQLSAKALERRQDEVVDVLHQTLVSPDFSDLERLEFLIESELEYSYEAVGTLGDRWARLESEAPIHEQAQWQRIRRGRPAIQALQKLQRLLETNPQGAVDLLNTKWKALLALPCLVFSSGGTAAKAQGQRLARRLSTAAHWDREHRGRPLAIPAAPPVDSVLTGTTPVQFCHQAWAAPLANHPDAPPLELLSRWIEHGFLLGAVRERGSAYGATAGVDDGIFSMSSYRDPRLLETFQDFQSAVAWACKDPMSEQALVEAKISALQRMAAPRTPQQHALQTLALFFTGTTTSDRQLFRERLLEATAEQVQSAARTWLDVPPAGRWAFTEASKAPPWFASLSAWPAPADE